jgi:ADP-ribosylglycohydrolase
MSPLSFESRFKGGILGLAVGDALGVAIEFRSREEIARNPVTGMRGHGTHNQPAGTWSDDTSMALCLLEGLATQQDLGGIADLFHRWMTECYWTATGTVFDVGQTTREALLRIDDFDDPRQAGVTTEYGNGNGSLMRTLPVALMRCGDSSEAMAELAHDVSAITHAHPRSQMACGIYCDLVARILQGESAGSAWEDTREWATAYYGNLFPKELPTYQQILSRGAASWCTVPARSIQSTGYVVHTLEAALWCFFTTASFRDCALKAVNLGDDADTTGAVAGGLAGVAYGVTEIPAQWLETLARRGDIEALATQALERRGVVA